MKGIKQESPEPSMLWENQMARRMEDLRQGRRNPRNALSMAYIFILTTLLVHSGALIYILLIFFSL
jgi:hypothetical protein